MQLGKNTKNKLPSLPIATLDFETDPFLHGRIPIPFSWGFYDGTTYHECWIKNASTTPTLCVEKLIEFLNDLEEPHLILAHNGGKFDFMFLLPYLSGKIRLVNGRILEAQLGIHTLRDSYAILPVPLSKFGDKLDIDYQKLEENVREKHRSEILAYLKQDCKALHEVVNRFYAEFGDALTIGSVAMKELRKLHPFKSVNKFFDKEFRKFYYGGRCQCFETGIISGNFIGLDINSSYPNVMKNFLHPISDDYTNTTVIKPNTIFLIWKGKNLNAVPIRTKSGLDFTCPEGEFFSTIHEYKVGLETGTIIPKTIVLCFNFKDVTSFADFVDHFYNLRLLAQKNGDKFLVIFYKLILNSAYGKFAQDPQDFEDAIITQWGDKPPSEPWELKYDHDEYKIWTKPAEGFQSFFNIATAGSITGAARANLLRGLSHSIRPLYCDTDSIFCESFTGDINAENLGDWKFEFDADQIAIAGKKLYAIHEINSKSDKFEKDKIKYETIIHNGRNYFGAWSKTASKGVRLKADDIVSIASGEMCEVNQDAPSFKLDGKHVFITRKIRRTNV